MCGIVGAVAGDDVLPVLLNGLRRLEYRGYDSAGIATINHEKRVSRPRSVGKIVELERALSGNEAMRGHTGIAHTRWASHGPPTQNNAHPHMSGERLALVCNGIIENHETLRAAQKSAGFEFRSDTDTEVVVNEIYTHLAEGKDLLSAVQETVRILEGAYAIGVISADEPDRLIGARRGSPLVVGLSEGAAFIASDMSALISETRNFIVLEDGDIVDIRNGSANILDREGNIVERSIRTSKLSPDAMELGDFRHYMLKEIHEQGVAIANTLEGRITGSRLLEECFGDRKSVV